MTEFSGIRNINNIQDIAIFFYCGVRSALPVCRLSCVVVLELEQRFLENKDSTRKFRYIIKSAINYRKETKWRAIFGNSSSQHEAKLKII
jgi:hypothetical protein